MTKTSKILEKFAAVTNRVNELRENYTDSLGRFGRIIPHKIRSEFDKKVEKIRESVEVSEEPVNQELTGEFASIHKKLITILLPDIRENLPKNLRERAFFGDISDDLIGEYVLAQLGRVVPPTESLIKEMRLDCDYENITYEMLNDKDFVEKVREKYSKLEKFYNEHEATESKKS